MAWSRLCIEERRVIESGRSAGFSYRTLGDLLGRDASAVRSFSWGYDLFAPTEIVVFSPGASWTALRCSGRWPGTGTGSVVTPLRRLNAEPTAGRCVPRQRSWMTGACSGGSGTC